MNICEIVNRIDKYETLKDSRFMKKRFEEHNKCCERLVNDKDYYKIFKDFIDKDYESFIRLANIDDYNASKAMYEYGDELLAKCIYQTERCIHFKRFSKYKEYLKKIYDKNMRLKEKYGDVVINEELIDMVDDHNRWLNYRLLYGKKIKNVIEDKYMEIDLVDKLLEILEGENDESI